MAFDVYPQPQTAPLTLGAGATSPAQSFAERTGLDGVTGLTASWIRISKIDPGDTCTPPVGPGDFVVHLSAGGPFVPVPIAPDPAIASIENGSAETVANARMYEESDGVYLVQILFPLDTTGNSWELQIENTSGSARDFVWVVADSDADSFQPWLDVRNTGAELPFECGGGHVLVDRPAYGQVQVTNLGTGPLAFTDTPGPLGGSDFELLSVPIPLGTKRCETFLVQYNAPATPGASADHVWDIGSDDVEAVTDSGSEHNRRVTISGAAGRFEMILLLDASGSMEKQPDGTGAGASFGDSRWDKLVEASQEVLDLIAFFGEGAGRFGVATFRGSDTVTDIATPAEISLGAIEAAKDAIADADTGGGTPMGMGIQHVTGEDDDEFGYFLGSTSSNDPNIEFNQRYLLVMSDGAHNGTAIHPTEFLPGGSGPNLVDKNIRIITVAYGDPGASYHEPDHELLTELAAESNGLALDAGANDDDLEGLRQSFIKAMESALCLDAWTDPVATLTASDPEHRHTAIVTPYDRRISFVVNWSSYDEDRVRIQLITPNCEVITPASAGRVDGVDFAGQIRHGMFNVSKRFIDNDADPDNPRYGEWTLVVSSDHLDGGETERYEHQIILDSRLRLEVDRSEPRFYTGDPIGLSLMVTLDGMPVPGTAMTVDIDRPRTSVGNWLATTEVSPAAYESSAEVLGVEGDVFSIKAHALRERGQIFRRHSSNTTTTLPDPDGDGIFETTIDSTSTPGTYEIYVTATGVLPEGYLFRREKKIQLYLGARPDPDYSIFDFGEIFREADMFEGVVQVRLRDRFGNFIIPRSGVEPHFELALEGGEIRRDFEVLSDGTIAQGVRFSAEDRPRLEIAYGRDRIFTSRDLVSVGVNTTFPADDIAFEPGREMESGSNVHADPGVLLGDPTTRRLDDFLALGVGGRVTVRPQEGTLVTQGDDDITVFVGETDARRPYAVEAREAAGEEWRRLGASEGGTSSFGLHRAGLDRATEVRVVDLSGRALDLEGEPSSAPGAAIRGVAFRSAEPGAAGLRVRDIDGIAGTFEAQLAKAGVVSVRGLADADPETFGPGIPGAKRREFVAKAKLAIRVAEELPDLSNVADVSVWDVLTMSARELGEGHGLPADVAEGLHDTLAPLQMALDDAALRRLQARDIQG